MFELRYSENYPIVVRQTRTVAGVNKKCCNRLSLSLFCSVSVDRGDLLDKTVQQFWSVRCVTVLLCCLNNRKLLSHFCYTSGAYW